MRRRPRSAWRSCRRNSGSGCRRTGPTWARRSTPPAGSCSRTPRRWWTASTSPRSSTRPSTASGKKITRAYKKKLSKAERKEFRSLMWEFRRRPQDLSAEEKAKLEGLFATLPRLRPLYEFRVRFQAIFDTAGGRRPAHRDLVGLFLDMQEEILNYFDAGQTSGPVEGINNKARVIVKRAYGLKCADSLWTRLVLDLNRAGEVVRHTIDQIRAMAAGFRRLFSLACT